MIIRRASIEDALELADLGARTFRDTFLQQNDPALIEAHINNTFAPEAIEDEIREPDNTFLVTTGPQGARLVGYAKLSRTQANSAVTGAKPIELGRLYVARESIGSGIGSALIQACLDEASNAGYETIWLGVWEVNPLAIVFYHRWNFKTAGSRIFMLGSEAQTDLIMSRPVRGSN